MKAAKHHVEVHKTHTGEGHNISHHHHYKKGGELKRAKGGKIPDGGQVGDIEERGHHEIKVSRKRGGKVDGEKPMHRADKRARGGRMTPHDPFSGAASEQMPYERGQEPTKSRGEGKDRD